MRNLPSANGKFLDLMDRVSDVQRKRARNDIKSQRARIRELKKQKKAE